MTDQTTSIDPYEDAPKKALFRYPDPELILDESYVLPSISRLKHIVDHNHVQTVTLGRLRATLGHGRLGKHVLREIAAALYAEGLDYFPRYLIAEAEQPRAWDRVHVYGRNTRLGVVISTALGEKSGIEQREGMHAMRDMNKDDLASTLIQARSLVEELAVLLES